jgi:hypothetical protein
MLRMARAKVSGFDATRGGHGMNEQADRIVRAFVFRTKDGGDDEWYWTTQEPIPDGEGGVMVSRLTGPFENEDEAWEDAENNLFPGVKLRDGGGRWQ